MVKSYVFCRLLLKDVLLREDSKLRSENLGVPWVNLLSFSFPFSPLSYFHPSAFFSYSLTFSFLRFPFLPLLSLLFLSSLLLFSFWAPGIPRGDSWTCFQESPFLMLRRSYVNDRDRTGVSFMEGKHLSSCFWISFILIIVKLWSLQSGKFSELFPFYFITQTIDRRYKNWISEQACQNKNCRRSIYLIPLDWQMCFDNRKHLSWSQNYLIFGRRLRWTESNIDFILYFLEQYNEQTFFLYRRCLVYLVIIKTFI